MTLIDGSQFILLRSPLSLLRRMWDVWNSTFLMLLRALLSTQRVSFPSCMDRMVTFLCNPMLFQKPAIAPCQYLSIWRRQWKHPCFVMLNVGSLLLFRSGLLQSGVAPWWLQPRKTVAPSGPLIISIWTHNVCVRHTTLVFLFISRCRCLRVPRKLFLTLWMATIQCHSMLNLSIWQHSLLSGEVLCIFVCPRVIWPLVMRIPGVRMTSSKMSKGRSNVLLQDDGIEESFYQTFDYLMRCAKNSVVKSHAKFQFCPRWCGVYGFDIDKVFGWLPRNLCCQLLMAFLLRATSQKLGHGLAWSTRLPRLPWV